MLRTVTVIIPAYNNLPLLSRCIDSCIQNIDPRHTVVILDDCSTEPKVADAVRRQIAGKAQFRYEWNQENLGFVGTCNRGVREFAASGNDILLLNADTEVTPGFLEEMLACLYDCDRHGVCCPRSNAATLCTIPLRIAGKHEDVADISYRCWQKVKMLFPRYAVVPTGVGFCMLIRRTLIDRFGFFDPAYGRGYNEENDFCCRINRFGYSVVLANRAFVFHEVGGSFTESERHYLDGRNRRLLLSRYPEYRSAVDSYFGLDLPAYEHFADLFGECYPRKKILIDLSHLVPVYNGTTEYALSLLRFLHPILSKEFDVSILINPPSDEMFNVSGTYQHVRHTSESIDERFDLAFVPQQVVGQFQLEQLNRLALRWVINVQDIIALRCAYLHTANALFSSRFAVRYADGILSVSQASLADLRQYLGDHAFRPDALSCAILHAFPGPKEQKENTDVGEEHCVPDGPFIFLVGNHFEHKAVVSALEHVPPELQMVVLGGDASRLDIDGRKILFLQSGSISGTSINALYRKASVVLFPTQYEGFGLPLLHATGLGKPVVACDTAVTREIVQSLGIGDLVYLFNSFEEIPVLLRRACDTRHAPPAARRTWWEAALETAFFLRSVLDRPVDLRLLEERNMLLKTQERIRHELDAQSWERRLRAFAAKCVRKSRRYLHLY